MMELFDKKFVYFTWDDELEGKKVFVANYITELQLSVRIGDKGNSDIVTYSKDKSAPFQTMTGGLRRWQFAYYDPNYEVKKAFKEGKEIQFQSADGEWNSIVGEDMLKWYIEEGCKLRVKPECPCAAGIDSKACVGCEHSEDGKRHPFENYHCYGCDKSSKKKYRPYESSAEMIVDFIDRFKVNCPSYAEPLIWVKGKHCYARFLIFAFYETFIKFNDDTPFMFKELFDDYTYLDGSPVGRESV